MLNDPDINEIDNAMAFWEKYPDAKELLLNKQEIFNPEYVQK